MKNEQKWLLEQMYQEGYRDIKIIGVYAYFVNPTFFENGKDFKVRDHTPRIPCKVLGLSPKTDKYSISALLGIVEWEKVPVDTRIIVETTYETLRMHFARYEEDKVLYFYNGGTSWSTELVSSAKPCNVRLAENASN